MSKGLPLTTNNIVSVLKKAGFVTKKDLSDFATKSDLSNGLGSLRKQINDDQFEARAEFYSQMTKPEMQKMEERLDNRIDKLDNKLSAEISWLKDDVKGLTAEFATTSSRNKFEKLKKSVIAS